ncbi:MAG: hypothetical protein WCO06_05010 [Candidatus Roizmanbacteria bacterium]
MQEGLGHSERVVTPSPLDRITQARKLIRFDTKKDSPLLSFETSVLPFAGKTSLIPEHTLVQSAWRSALDQEGIVPGVVNKMVWFSKLLKGTDIYPNNTGLQL